MPSWTRCVPASLIGQGPENQEVPPASWNQAWPVPWTTVDSRIARGPIVQVEGLAEVAAGRAVDVSVARGGPQVVVRAVRIGPGGTVEVHRQHAVHQDDVVRDVVRRRVAVP